MSFKRPDVKFFTLSMRDVIGKDALNVILDQHRIHPSNIISITPAMIPSQPDSFIIWYKSQANS